MNMIFYLKSPKPEAQTLLYMVCQINGKRLKYSTRLQIYPKQWNKTKGKLYADSENRKEVNEIMKFCDLKCLTTDHHSYKHLKKSILSIRHYS